MFTRTAVRRGLLILFGCVLSLGCARQNVIPPATQPATVIYVDQPATALAFAPSAVTESPAVAFSGGSGGGVLAADDRGGRQPRAFVGYESAVTEYYWLRTDDRIRFYPGQSRGSGWTGGGNYDRYERRAVTTRVGVRYR